MIMERGWNDTAASQGMPKTASSPPEARKWQRRIPLQWDPGSTDTFNFRLLASTTEKIKFLLLESMWFILFCSSNPKMLIHIASKNLYDEISAYFIKVLLRHLTFIPVRLFLHILEHTF